MRSFNARHSLSYLSLALVPSLSYAYTWNFESTPRQCGTVNISLSGSGTPPYSVLVIPFGPSPFSNGVEVRRIFQQNFTGSSGSFQLDYPQNSQFVAVVSDQSGFGSGGTSGAVTVLESTNNDSSCYNTSTSVTPDFVYSLVPNSLTQCTPTRIWWDPNGTVQGTPFFQGVIPGGQSFNVAQGTLTTVSEQGLGFNWSPSVRAGTTVIVVAGDNRGAGSGGSSPYVIGYNAQNDNSCLNSTSPSSTAGSPAGGSYPTSTSGASPGSGSSKSNVGPIVGGVIGGVVGFIALILVGIFWWRRHNFHKSQKERPVDLLNDRDDDGDQGALPQYYQPEPFMVPDPTVASSVGGAEDGGRSEAGGTGTHRPSLDQPQSARFSRYSLTTSADMHGGRRSATPEQSAISSSTYMRKSPIPPSSFRPVNIIQHDDAGPSTEYPPPDEPETIELPPAYTNIKPPAAPPAEPTTTTATATATTPPEPPAAENLI